MNPLNTSLSRRRFLQASAGTAAAAALGGLGTASRVVAQDGPTGVFNWMTWADHYYQEQLDEIQGAIGIGPSVTELADNADGFTKLLEVRGQLDMISGDALWNPRYHQEGLIEAFDINELEVAQHLYPLAREFDIWTVPEGYLGFPFGWSPVQVYYNPKFVDPAPDSWEVFLDPKYQGRVVMENQPVEVTAYMGKFTGAADPYNMTDEELAAAKAAMEQLKPNILVLTQQAQETWRLLATEEAWIATANLGADEVVKSELNGPDLAVFTPKEGTIGWMDAEMIVAEGANKDLVIPFLERSNQPEYIAENFIRYGRPLFNESAYKVLVDAGHQERADRFLFNQPETVLTMTLKGPGESTQGAIAAFNEVFGA
jgi:spermidine/putrescine transport system substrate-binding protein